MDKGTTLGESDWGRIALADILPSHKSIIYTKIHTLVKRNLIFTIFKMQLHCNIILLNVMWQAHDFFYITSK